MNWQDVLNVGLVVIGSLGGGGAIVLALSNWLGRLWADRLAQRERFRNDQELANLRGIVEAGLKRLDAALGHRNFLLQEIAKMELEGLQECWQKARACVPAVNAPRAHDSGTDLDDLNARFKVLQQAHNALLDASNRHEPFLPEPVVALLERIRQAAALELSNIEHHERFKGNWWEEGERNQVIVRDSTEALRWLVKARFAELSAEVRLPAGAGEA